MTEILHHLLDMPAETEIVEFKRAEKSFSDSDLGQYFSALSNEATLKGVEQAWLVFGVDNRTHALTNSQYRNSRPALDEMKKKLADQTTNRITFNEIYAFKYAGKRVVMFQIPAAPKGIPIAYQGHYYGRDGESLVALNLHEIEVIRAQALQNGDWSAETVACATMNDIDSEAVKYFVNEGIESDRLPKSTKRESVQKVLDGLNLIAPNGQLRRAAIILFGKNPLKFFPGVRFRIGRFGQSGTDLLSQDVVDGNVIQMADRVVEILKNKYLVSTMEYDGLKRREVLEIPVKALREILYNALAHKDYSGTDIQMQVFSDCVVVWNEGQLPAGYSLETLMQPHKSRARNQMIADVFFRAGFIEAWGRGIGIVYDEMSAKGLKMPVWKSICGGIEVTVGREVYRNLNSEIGTTGPEVGAIPLKIGTIPTETGTRDWRIEINAIKNLQKRQVELMLQLMEIVSADNKLSYSDLAKLTGKSRSTIQLYMLYLSDHGFIRRVGDKYSGHWEVR